VKQNKDKKSIYKVQAPERALDILDCFSFQDSASATLSPAAISSKTFNQKNISCSMPLTNNE
jgi:arginine utilization protein RocB